MKIVVFEPNDIAFLKGQNFSILLVMRSEREFSGKINWHEVIPEFDRVVVSSARIISTSYLRVGF
jgi:hypothetical protein